MNFADRLEAQADARKAARVAKAAQDGIGRLPTIDQLIELGAPPEVIALAREALAGLHELAGMAEQEDSDP